MPTVLLIGEDNLLQQTRAAVLRTTGASTVCSNADRALAEQEKCHCDLVVLCHTLSELRSTTLAETIHVRWPGTAILLLTPTREWEASDPGHAINAITSGDPEQLIGRAIELLPRPWAGCS